MTTFLPTSCEADAGAAFARAMLPNVSMPSLSMPSLPFDCSRSDLARKCAQAILGDGVEPDCACLDLECYSASELVNPQSQQCIDTCKAPPSIAAICSNWDDEQTFCAFYGVFQCVATSEVCDASKLAPTKCEADCTAQSQTVGGDPGEQLDVFLQCLTDCEPAADRENAAARLEIIEADA